MEGLELQCFQMITYAGDARSKYVQAIRAAKTGDFQEAQSLMAAGKVSFIEAHKVHSELLPAEAGGAELKFSILLTHAEDQLMSAESMEIVGNELIGICQELFQLKKELHKE